MRGLAYYTGTVFELFDTGRTLRAICGGGRYDDLLEALGGVDLPALGFGMGDVVLAELLRERGLAPAEAASIDVFLAAVTEEDLPHVLALAHELRDAGLRAEYALGAQPVGKQLKLADARNARVAVVIGPDDRARGEVMLKELRGRAGRCRAVRSSSGCCGWFGGMNHRHGGRKPPQQRTSGCLCSSPCPLGPVANTKGQRCTTPGRGSTNGGNKALTTRAADFSAWYNELIARARAGGLQPGARLHGHPARTATRIWEQMQRALDQMFKDTGHQNAYFPLFIPQSFLRREAEHVEGFAPEMAVVTHGGGKELEEPLVVRPTSETIIYAMYAKWVQSYRDLPLLINQWANVVRWEMRTRLFLRTHRVPLAGGPHRARHRGRGRGGDAAGCSASTATFMEEWMAMPVVTGQKTDSERFAGALRTYSCEAMMQDNKALQAGTSRTTSARTSPRRSTSPSRPPTATWSTSGTRRGASPRAWWARSS